MIVVILFLLLVLVLFVVSFGVHLLWIAAAVAVIAWMLGLGRYRRRRYDRYGRYDDRYDRDGWFRR
ncbi:ABC-type bacteriocin/lantibiotic exporter with double-glycine peptidase domain [Streptacidiphilus sp. MAP12-16]|uniref:hydrophobic protein n=1 Tax=Streptacidiphilus sp. MAP12-16 TaxID=3156300 RepID=UPI003515BC51